MESITWWTRNGEAVRQAIALGEFVHMETASEELTQAIVDDLCGRFPQVPHSSLTIWDWSGKITVSPLRPSGMPALLLQAHDRLPQPG